MTVRRVLLLAGAASLLVSPLAFSAHRLADARRRLDWSQAQLVATAATAQRIMDLRSRRQQVADRKRPEQDVIARVTGSLARTGIRSDRLSGVSPESDSALPGNPETGVYRRQAVRLSLSRLSVPELGLLLGDWRASQALWTPTQIELLHARDGDGSDRYDVNILLATTYLADE